MTMDQEEKDLNAMATLASSVAVIDSYTKVLTGTLAAFTMTPEDSPDKEIATKLASETLQALLWEVQLLRFLRETPGKVYPSHL
jgi:hypothetical protein